MKNPFLIEGPAVISFSGGRTSAYMLRRILDAHGDALPDDVYVIFADTGKERPETYDFVRECAERWRVHVHWVKRPGGFEKLIEERSYLPNGISRFCTSELKVVPISDFMVSRGFDFWSMVVGIRADEPARVARMRDKIDTRWDYDLPLATAGVTEREILTYWESQPFDLELAPHEGNCDLCFLKGKRNLVGLVMKRPDLATWWIAQEDKIGGRFRSRWSYREIVKIAENMRRQTSLGIDVDVRHVSRAPRAASPRASAGAQLALMFPDDDSKPCLCGD